MRLATANFWGEKLDSYGIPKPFHRYLLVEDEVENLGKRIRLVTITAVTSPGPMPSESVLAIESSTPEEALQKAFDILSNHSQNKGLQKKLSTHK